ncbi:hypothetical protein [Algoriphagus sp. NG3]|uniref:hypothetical protein n=1 Tax=unclassified Algoriphagus TaxID=2641541 RepID=UPI002A81941F|nr:hypothetical protein [Algoriphagus sp. NG3]WPR73804.1 hypothetical protein SLW71_14060 [Algoriphagus sp. NG3]
MKKIMLILGLGALGLSPYVQVNAACTDGEGNEMLFEDPSGIYVKSKHAGSGACRGCGDCIIYIN